MSSKPEKTSGNSPVYARGDYTDMVNTTTQQDMINKKKEFKHSVFKAPYQDASDYQGMEFIMTPNSVEPINLQFPKFPEIVLQENNFSFLPEGEESKTECGECFVDGATNNQLIRCDCDNNAFPNELIICITGKFTEITFIKPYVNSVKLLSQWPLGNGCVNRCYIFKLGDCKEVSNQLCREGQFGNQIKKVIGYACGQPIYGLYVRDSECHQCNGSITISGSDTITTSSTSQYSATACYQNGLCESSAGVSWSVSGTGATISNTGLLTTNASACGVLTITANCPQCGTSDTHEVRVTDAGQWVTLDTCGAACSGCWTDWLYEGTVRKSACFAGCCQGDSSCNCTNCTYCDAPDCGNPYGIPYPNSDCGCASGSVGLWCRCTWWRVQEWTC